MILSATHCIYSVPTHPAGLPSKKGHVSSTLNQVFGKPSSEFTTTTREESKRRCIYFDLHEEMVPYSSAWDWQKLIVKMKKGRDVDDEDFVLVLQHSPVYTMGAGASKEYLNFDADNSPYDLYRTDRGGEVTYHGPGQLVMYPIINLRYHKMDLHWYLRALEEVLIRVLSSTFSIKASQVEGLTGVWVGNQKLAAIGVHVSRWITSHGLALNVTTDLTPFQQIVPCGIQNRQVGSIKGLLRESLSSNYADDSQLINITHNSLIKEFSEVFQLELEKKPNCSMVKELSSLQ